MRLASIASLLLLPTLVAAAQHMPAGMVGRGIVMAALYSANPSAIVDYVAAMRRYEAEAARREQPENPFRVQGALRPREPWTWTAANGDVVRRLQEGVFVVWRGDYSANWFTDLHCTILEWPTFQCSDGQIMTMSAPDPDTVIFGDVEYRR